MYSGFHCIHLYPYEIEMFMHALTYMHTSKRERESWQGWCDNGFELLFWIWTNECLPWNTVHYIKGKVNNFDTHNLCMFFVFFFKKLSDLIIKISKHTYNSIHHIYNWPHHFFNYYDWISSQNIDILSISCLEVK